MKHLLSISISLIISTALYAQENKQNSPYSRYGIGDLFPQYFANQAGIAGQTAAFHDPFHLNPSNPASFAFLNATSLETAFYGKYSQYKDDKNLLDVWSGNLSYLALGFTLRSPINEVLDKQKSPWKLGMGLSITPNSLVGYNITTLDTIDTGTVRNRFFGSGGTYRFTWSNGIRYKRTALGVNLGWIFGKMGYESETDFEDKPLPAYVDNFRDDIRTNGFVWNIGGQHDFVLKYAEKTRETPSEWITLGFTAEGNHTLNLSSDKFRLRSRGRLPNGKYQNPDTLLNVSGIDQELILPAGFTVGIQYGKGNKIKIGGQFGYEKWSSYKNDARPNDKMRDIFSVSGGFEFTPDAYSFNRYLRRVRYRLGAYYRQDPRIIALNSEINDVGLTLGFGFPLILPRQQASFINTAFEFGRLGAGTKIVENYARITVGFTLNDNSWFYKRRFE
jgi:hypothetical protein